VFEQNENTPNCRKPEKRPLTFSSLMSLDRKWQPVRSRMITPSTRIIPEENFG
jgi:hypothetical protein